MLPDPPADYLPEAAIPGSPGAQRLHTSWRGDQGAGLSVPGFPTSNEASAPSTPRDPSSSGKTNQFHPEPDARGQARVAACSVLPARVLLLPWAPAPPSCPFSSGCAEIIP